MNKQYTKPALSGFLFGSIGLYFIQLFAGQLSFTQPLTSLYTIPLSWLSWLTNIQQPIVQFLVLGLFYALVFVVLIAGYKYYKDHKPHSPKL